MFFNLETLCFSKITDCFGIQDIHIIENKNKYVTDESVSLGAENG